jgi:type III pantothenate kinase
MLNKQPECRMLLAINVGNTNTKFGLYDNATRRFSWRVTSDSRRTVNEWATLLYSHLAVQHFPLSTITACIISSVVPPITIALRRLVSPWIGGEPLIISPDLRLGITIATENAGADRIVNAAAAFQRYDGPSIVVDLGTATTFSVVTADGLFVGGAIAAGVGSSAETLTNRAACLPAVDLVRPRRAIGRTTEEGLQAGIIFGHVGLVEGIVSHLKADLHLEAVRVIATGGFCHLIAPETAIISHIDPDLTLDGLQMIYEMNRSG